MKSEMNPIKLCGLPLILLAATVSGCLKQQMFEDEIVFKTNVDKIVISAEGEKVLDPDSQYKTTIYDTVLVTCNRNFSTKIEPEVDWVSVESEGEINLSGTTKQMPVVLVFSRNRSLNARSADLVLYSEHKSIRVPLSQSAPDYFIETEVNKNEVIPMRDTCVVTILSNTRWTAELDKEQTDASVTLTKTAGRDNGKVGVCFGYNFDLLQTKKAVVRIKPENVDKLIEYTVIQRNGQPFIMINQDDFTAAPEDEFSAFTLTSNVDWKISLEETGFTGGKVVTLESYKANPSTPSSWETAVEGNPVEAVQLAYVADHGLDPGLDKQVTIKAEISDGTSSDELKISQKGCIHLDFLDIVPGKEGTESGFYKNHYTEASWPFEYPSYAQRCTTWNGCIKTPEAYPFNAHKYGEVTFILKGGCVMPICAHAYNTGDKDKDEAGGGGVWMDSKGFQIGYGMGAPDYIKTPALEGLTLRKIIFEPNYAQGLNTVWIREADGVEAVEGFTTAWKYTKAGTARSEHDKLFVHVFTDSVENTSYRISFEQTTCCSSLKELVLIYE